jgi:hypothetical protein
VITTSLGWTAGYNSVTLVVEFIGSAASVGFVRRNQPGVGLCVPSCSTEHRVFCSFGWCRRAVIHRQGFFNRISVASGVGPGGIMQRVTRCSEPDPTQTGSVGFTGPCRSWSFIKSFVRSSSGA